jgi:parvulin-like peptidyl-prolyl isomerase
MSPSANDRPGSVPAAAAPAEEAPTTIAAQHILVAYKGAKGAAKTITRSKADAKKRAEEALAKAKKGDDFSALVKDYSDEPGAAARQGNLGKFARGAMVKPFEDAAFALKVGEISGVVETDFGFHVIKRNQ